MSPPVESISLWNGLICVFIIHSSITPTDWMEKFNPV